MRAKLEELLAAWAERGLPRLDTRIGLNTGEVLVGNFGAETRLNYTVMGDAVNLASRLENLNKRYGTRIIVGEGTAERVKKRFVLRPLEWVAVKGKSRAVLIHELVGREGDVDPEVLAHIEGYEAALELYRRRQFADAAAGFEALSPLREGDLAPALMAAQARALEADPPPDDWNGATTMTTK
jgi:adenylate cyclase